MQETYGEVFSLRWRNYQWSSGVKQAALKFAFYLGVQLAGYAIDMGSFLILLHAFDITPLPANIVGKVIAGTFAFLVHRKYTFPVATEGDARRQAVLYAALVAFNIPLSSALLAGMLQLIEFVPLAKFVADISCIGLTYWLSKRFVFSAARRKSRPLE